jgi:hypothetical protein
MRFLVLWCMGSVDKKFRELEHDANRDTSNDTIAYWRYMANNGVHPLMILKNQAEYLDTFSNDACLFYLTFTFVDGTDGIANGIGRHVLSYVGTEGDGDIRRREIQKEIEKEKKEIRRRQETVERLESEYANTL